MLIRAEFTQFWTDSLPKDGVVSTLYFRSQGLNDNSGFNDILAELIGPDWQLTATNWANNYHTTLTTAAGGGTPPMALGQGVECKLYDMAQPLPRAPLAIGKVNAVSALADNEGNREVALCLSFYGTRNVPRQRGRIYCGPFVANEVGKYQPSANVVGAVHAFGAAFAGWQFQTVNPLPAIDADWCVFSRGARVHRAHKSDPVGALLPEATYKVTNGWVDNEWDVVHARRVAADSRSLFGPVQA